MTGLLPESDVILEIATIVTDKHLLLLANGPVIAIHQSDALLAGMDDWNKKQHGGSGLLARGQYQRDECSPRPSAPRSSFSKAWVEGGRSPMCGNSICQDRRFLARQMPQLEKFFHYRNLDVSTLKELALRGAPHVAQGVKKSSTHLALDDVLESIAELRHYREHTSYGLARKVQVSTTVSGFRDMLSMP